MFGCVELQEWLCNLEGLQTLWRHLKGQAQRPLDADFAIAEILSIENFPLCGRMRGFYRLDDFEPFEFQVAECERLVLASVLMGGAELFRLGPCRKIVLRRPYCTR